jgi:ribonuclease P protein component
VQKINLDRSRY